jgi:hypothetical protein
VVHVTAFGECFEVTCKNFSGGRTQTSVVREHRLVLLGNTEYVYLKNEEQKKTKNPASK